MGFPNGGIALCRRDASVLRRVADELQEVVVGSIGRRCHWSPSVICAVEDQFDHEAGFLGPGIAELAKIEPGVGRFREKKAHFHRFVIAQPHLTARHGRSVSICYTMHDRESASNCRAVTSARHADLVIAGGVGGSLPIGQPTRRDAGDRHLGRGGPQLRRLTGEDAIGHYARQRCVTAMMTPVQWRVAGVVLAVPALVAMGFVIGHYSERANRIAYDQVIGEVTTSDA